MKIEANDLEKILKEHGAEWKEKLEEISNDPEMREKLKGLSGNAEEIGKKIEEIFKDLEKKKE